MSKTLYLFVDESGNFDFSPGGTKYFILAILSTLDPAKIGKPLLELRYSLLPDYKCGKAMEEQGYFHAAEDQQSVRDKVFEILSCDKLNIRVDSIVAQKNKAEPRFYGKRKDFYGVLVRPLLKYAFSRASWRGYSHVVVLFSSIFDKKIRGILKQEFKSFIKGHTALPFSIYFHDSKFDLCSQATDYYCWAIFRKWESGDNRSFNIVRSCIRSEFAVFGRGKKEFYVYKK